MIDVKRELLSPVRAAAIVVVFLVAFSGVNALAQDAPANDATPTMGFEASDEVPKENLPGWPFLYGAYSFIWLFIFLYVGSLWLKQRKLDASIERLDKRLDDIDKSLSELSPSGD